MQVDLELPWPPSINRLWTTTRSGSWYVTKKARDYKRTVYFIINQFKRPKFAITDVLHLTLIAHPPDKRKRDLDNLLKVLLDALQASGLFEDDFQIKTMYLEMACPDSNKKGYVRVNISSRNPECSFPSAAGPTSSWSM